MRTQNFVDNARFASEFTSWARNANATIMVIDSDQNTIFVNMTAHDSTVRSFRCDSGRLRTAVKLQLAGICRQGEGYMRTSQIMCEDGAVLSMISLSSVRSGFIACSLRNIHLFVYLIRAQEIFMHYAWPSRGIISKVMLNGNFGYV